VWFQHWILVVFGTGCVNEGDKKNVFSMTEPRARMVHWDQLIGVTIIINNLLAYTAN